jgi:hypothetical protein
VRAALFAIAFIACGHAPPKPIVKPPPGDAGVMVDASAIIDAGPPKIEVLAARHDRIAPGTREIEKREIDLAKDHELALGAFEGDTCVRAAFDADAPTAIVLVNAHGTTLARADGTEGTLGPAGPICFKKGDTATFRFEGQSRLRLVIWASP